MTDPILELQQLARGRGTIPGSRVGWLCPVCFVSVNPSCPICPNSTGDRVRHTVPVETEMFVYQRDAFRCQACGAEERLTLDHIHPILHGGTNSPSNLRVLCVSCNSSKGARV